MNSALVALGLAALFAGLVLLFIYNTVWKNRRIRARPFPPEWAEILRTHLPVYKVLSTAEQQTLQQLVNLFIAKKRFVGCGGLEVTDEMRVSIAAEACLLLLHQKRSVYPKLTSVLIYPYGFKVQRNEQLDNGTVSRAENALSGESWSNGRVILSWDDVVSGATNFKDGRNVVLHEFAHQLDSESGNTNGAPLLRRNSYQSWATVFSANFEDLSWRSQKRKKTVMDEYGTTNPAEFFAVATETFFEKPQALQARRPELYEELKQYYQLDPQTWHEKL